MRRVIRHVEENLSQSIMLDELAGITRLSSSHFCRSFKMTMGDTPHRFVGETPLAWQGAE